MTAQYDGAINGNFREQYASAELPAENRASPKDRVEVWCEPACAGVHMSSRESFRSKVSGVPFYKHSRQVYQQFQWRVKDFSQLSSTSLSRQISYLVHWADYQLTY